MGFYSRTIFPFLCDLLMQPTFLAEHRRELLATVDGEVLEIGFGTGLNLPHYPPHVRKITTVDPNPGMTRRAQQRSQQSGIEVDHHPGHGERLPFVDGRFDCVVSSWTLCSIADVEQALREVRRVLKPGGRFLFLEHGISPDPRVQKWQRRINGLQMRLADGCRLDRNIRELVSAQPFASVAVREFSLDVFPRTHCYTYRGTATK